MSKSMSKSTSNRSSLKGIKIKRSSPGFGALRYVDEITSEKDITEFEPLTVKSTRGKTPAEAALIVMKYVHKAVGGSARPVGISSLDKLLSLRTDPAIQLLKRTTWNDFFRNQGVIQNVEGVNTFDRPMSAQRKNQQNKFAKSKSLPNLLMRNTEADVIHKNSENVWSDIQSMKHESFDNGDNAFPDLTRANSSHVKAPVSLTEDMFDGDNQLSYFFESLVDRVETLWRELKVSSSEKGFFRQNLCKAPVNSLDQCRELVRYMDALNNHRYKTVEVLRAISKREQSLLRLISFFNVLEAEMNRYNHANNNVNENVSDLFQLFMTMQVKEELVTILKEMQTSSIDVIRQTQLWRRNLWRPHPFVWEGLNYFAKMKTDLLALTSNHFLVEILLTIPLRVTDLLCIVFLEYDGGNIPVHNTQIGGQPPVGENVSAGSSIPDESKTSFAAIEGIPNGYSSLRDLFFADVNLQELIAATKVVLDDATLQQSLKSEMRILRSNGVFIPTTKFGEQAVAPS